MNQNNFDQRLGVLIKKKYLNSVYVDFY